MQDNLEAVMSVLQFIYDNIMYAELNTKSDYCQCCGYDGEIKIVEDDGKLVWSAQVRQPRPEQAERCPPHLRLYRHPVLESGPHPGDQGPRAASVTLSVNASHCQLPGGAFIEYHYELRNHQILRHRQRAGRPHQRLRFRLPPPLPRLLQLRGLDFAYGQPFDKATRNQVFASCQPDYIAGLSLLGGEPFEPENQRELLPFVRNFKALYPNKTVWCYSGYTWEQLTGKEPCAARCEVTDELLQLLDVLVDGEFVQAKHDISLRFRGSSNQRLLDVPRTLAAGQPVWWEDEAVFATHTMDRN